MFGLFKPKVYTVFVSGLFYKADDAELEQYLSAGIAQLEAERDALRQQLAERAAKQQGEGVKS